MARRSPMMAASPLESQNESSWAWSSTTRTGSLAASVTARISASLVEMSSSPMTSDSEAVGVTLDVDG